MPCPPELAKLVACVCNTVLACLTPLPRPALPPQEDSPDDEEAGSKEAAPKDEPVNKVLMQAFTLTFLAEWGDRSQIATIALAAAREPFGVTLGACIGHSLCTGLAVVGGKLLASSIKERTVLLVGGVLFCIFAVLAILGAGS